MDTSTFHRKVLAMAAFRDIAHGIMAQQDNKPLSQRNYREFSKMRFGRNIDREDIRDSGILDIWDSPHSHPMMQALQYANYLKPFAGDGDRTNDTRAWDVFSSFSFSPNQITIPFMKVGSRGSNNKKKLDKEENKIDFWKCARSTAFERVVFLMFLIHLSQEIPRVSEGNILGKRKRFRYFTKTRLNSQKLAFAIQRVIRAWDRVARCFGFKDVQDMLIPYMVPSAEFDSFRPLGSRKEGYAPADLERTFSNRLSPTTNEALIAPRSLAYTDDVDQGFRKLTKHFLADLRLVAEDEEFYEEDIQTWSHGETFPKEGPLERFQAMTGTLQRLQDALGMEEELEFLVPQSRDGSSVGSAKHSSTVTTAAPLVEGACSDVCEECEQARSVIRSVMGRYCRMHNTEFRNLINADSTLRPQDSENIAGKVQLVLTRPPPTNPCTHNPHSTEEEIDETDMQDVVSLIHELLRPGGHALLFCSQEQIAMWSKIFAESTSTDEDGTSEFNFEVDKNVFIFAYKPGVSTASNMLGTRHKNLKPDDATVTNVTMQAVHVMKMGCSRKDAAKMIRLKHFGYVQSRHPGTANLIDNVPKQQPSEQIYVRDGINAGRWIFPQEGVCVPLLMELTCRFSGPGDIIVELFSKGFTLGVASCAIGNEEMRLFVGCDIDQDLFSPSERRVIEGFASIVADKSRRSVVLPANQFTKDVIQAATVVVSHTKTPVSARNIWSRPNGLPELSVLPKYITEHVALVMKEVRRQHLFCGKPFHEWPNDIKGKMQTMNFEHLLALECLKYGLYISKSKINHHQAGFGVFANRSFSKGDYIAPYYGRLVYDDLSNRALGIPANRTKPYGEGFTSVDGNEFLNYAMVLKVSRDSDFKTLLPPERVQDIENPFREIYVVPFLFNVAARINDPRPVAGDMDYLLGEPRECNVEYVQKMAHNRIKKIQQLVETDALAVVATRHISKDAELYVHYGSDHKLNCIRAYLN